MHATPLLSLAVTQRVIVVTIGVLVVVLTTLISAAFGGDTSQFFMGVWIVLLKFSRGYGRPYSLNCTHPVAQVIPKWPGLRNSSLCLIAKQLSGWLSMRRTSTLKQA
jgi:hypothetical protein